MSSQQTQIVTNRKLTTQVIIRSAHANPHYCPNQI